MASAGGHFPLFFDLEESVMPRMKLTEKAIKALARTPTASR